MGKCRLECKSNACEGTTFVCEENAECQGTPLPCFIHKLGYKAPFAVDGVICPIVQFQGTATAEPTTGTPTHRPTHKPTTHAPTHPHPTTAWPTKHPTPEPTTFEPTTAQPSPEPTTATPTTHYPTVAS